MRCSGICSVYSVVDVDLYSIQSCRPTVQKALNIESLSNAQRDG